MELTATAPRVDPLTLPIDGRAQKVVSADGTRIHVTVYGADDAPAIVLIHGFSQQSRTWAYQVRDLAEEFRVVVYDQRGHGHSSWAETYAITALGEDLQAVLDATLHPGERAVIAGHSMGGITIMTWAHQYGVERAAAAVLVNTAASEIGQHFAVLGVPQPLHRYSNYVVRRRLMTIIQTRARRALRFLAFGTVAHPEHLEAVQQMLREASHRTLREFISALLAMNLTEVVPALTCPTVIVAGGRDRLLPPVHNARIAERLPNLEKLTMISTSGHMGPWEARGAVSSALRDAAATHLP